MQESAEFPKPENEKQCFCCYYWDVFRKYVWKISLFLVLFGILIILRRGGGNKAWYTVLIQGLYTPCCLQVLLTLSICCKTNRSNEKNIPVLILSFAVSGATMLLSSFSQEIIVSNNLEKRIQLQEFSCCTLV